MKILEILKLLVVKNHILLIFYSGIDVLFLYNTVEISY